MRNFPIWNIRFSFVLFHFPTVNFGDGEGRILRALNISSFGRHLIYFQTFRNDKIVIILTNIVDEFGIEENFYQLFWINECFCLCDVFACHSASHCHICQMMRTRNSLSRMEKKRNVRVNKPQKRWIQGNIEESSIHMKMKNATIPAKMRKMKGEERERKHRKKPKINVDTKWFCCFGPEFSLTLP